MNGPPKASPPPGAGDGLQRMKGFGKPSNPTYQDKVSFATVTDETSIHASIREWLDLVLPPGHRVFHPANGEIRDGRTAAKLKRLGVKPGVADLVIVSAGAKVAFLEVKTEKGRLSPAQKEFRDWCDVHSIPYRICRSIGDAREFVASLGIKTREAD